MTVEFNLSPYTQDFVTQFDAQTEGFVDLFNLVSVNEGVNLKGSRATATLAEDLVHVAGTSVSESSVTLSAVTIGEIAFEATQVRVSYQDIQKWGRDTAIDKKDNELIDQVSDHIDTRLASNLANFSENNLAAANFKEGLALAKGRVQAQRGFKGARTIAFVNTEDYYTYLAQADVATAQNLFGMDYVENFLGYERIFFSSKIAKGEFYVTAAGNLNLAHIPASGAAYSAINLLPADSGLIAAKHYLDDDTGDIITQVMFGLDAFPERVDAVVRVTLGGDAPTAQSVTVDDSEGTEGGEAVEV